MKKYPLPANEQERLARLAAYDLLGLEKDPDLDVFAEAASLITDCPISLIAMMEKDTQIIQSCIGLSLDVVERRYTACQYTILSQEVLVIDDTDTDERTVDNPLIREGNIRFYAGVPLLDDDGYALGTLCVIDYKPKKLDQKQIDSLEKLAKAITKMLLAKKRRIQAAYYAEIFTLTKNIICVIDKFYRLKDVNPAFEEGFGLAKEDVLHRSFSSVLQKEERTVHSILSSVHEERHAVSFTSTTKKKDGSIVSIDWYLKYHEASQEIFGFGRNVTNELDEKLKLEHSERRFRNFFENAIGLMSVHDLQGNILAVNEKGRNLLLYSEAEVKHLKLQEIVPTAHQPLLDQYLKRIAEIGEDSGMMVLLNKDGQEVHWLYQNMLETDGDGKPVVMSTAINMTDRIQLEQDLLYTKKILEQTNAVAKVGGWEVDLKKNLVYWSESCKDIHGVDKQYKPDFDSAVFFFENDSQDRIRYLFEKAVQNGQPYDEELRLRKQDGTVIWVRVKGIPEWEDGRCRRVFGIIQDIDSSKNTYLELERQEAMLQSFVDYVPASAAMFDREMNFVSVSRQWVNEFHQQGKNVLGENLYNIFKNVPEERRKIYAEALQGKAYKNTDQLIAMGTLAEAQHFNWEVQPWHMADGQIGGVIILVQNITDNVRANEELKTAKELADLASKAKSEFLANMSHEIRTPLNGVIGFSDLLLKTPLNEIQKQYLHYINESGNSLLNIINDILDFSKIESGKLELFIDRCDLHELGNQVINVVLYQAQRKNLELLLNIEPGLPTSIFIDEVRTKQVLINLLGNAVKFTEHGEIELRVEKLAINDNDISLRFSVRDTGIGIPEDKQQRIFDAFTQEDSSVSKKYGGTGLGLTISNTILRYMGSKLSLTSEMGKGATFAFDINVPYDASTEPIVEDLPIKRVLIVDDNENNRIIMEHMLAYRNIESRQATNGVEALTILAQGEHFDVVLMDYHMPILTGVETVDKIKAIFLSRGDTTPLIILHTSSEEEEVMAALRREEPVFSLLKPIKSQELYAMLQRATQQVVKEPRERNLENGDSAVSTDELTILIADDNPVNMALNIKMMQELLPQATLIEAANGLQAVRACEQHNVFDLILMDVQMPEVDGIEATRKIRRLSGYQTIPIIAVTAGNVLGEREKCLDAGMSDFLPKPVRLKDLHAVLKKFIQQKNVDWQQDILEEHHLDRQTLEEQVGDDVEFRSFFLRLVMQELQQSETKLDSAYQEADLVLLKGILHKLRGTTATAGLFKLAKLIVDAEQDLEILVKDFRLYGALKEEIKVANYLVQRLLNKPE